MKKLLFFIAIIAITLTTVALRAQHLFSVIQNNLSNENVIDLKNQISTSEIPVLSFTRDNEDHNVYSVSISSVENTRIIIFNEQTGNHVAIIPTAEAGTKFQLAPFFIEELKQGALGNAPRFFIAETSSDFLIRNIVSIPVPNDAVYIPQFFYGKKEDVKEALPKDRQIIHIFKQKPRLILAYPDDPELLSYAAQYEEEMTYYVYMYVLPDGTVCTYDEHFNPVPEDDAVAVGGTRGQLQFILTGNLNATQKTPTEFALGVWSEKLQGKNPIKINVDSKSLGYGVIGQSWAMPHFLNSGQVPDLPTQTYYHGSLWHQLIETPTYNGLNIKLEMNSNFSFYYGTTGSPGYQTDWVTVMLHEVTHGLGFSSTTQSDGKYYYVVNEQGSGYYVNYPSIFDRQLYQGSTGNIRLTDLDQAQRAALLISNNLYAGAPDSYLVNAHGGNRVKMYAPNPYQSGSSVSHWDNYPGFSTFMCYSIAQGFSMRSISTRELGIFKDMGWKEINPNAVFVTFNSNGGEGNMSQQEFTKGVAQNLKANTFNREGYTFLKWNTNANGTGTSYNDKQNITINADLTLYAQWEAKTYTLTFNPGAEGTVDVPSIQTTYGEPLGELPIAVRPGYTFTGWRIETNNVDEETIWNYTQNKTAVAKWQMTTYKITVFSTPGGKITPLTILIREDSSKTFKIIPNSGFWILDVLVDDESVGAVPEYTFEKVNADHTIHAIFTDVNSINESESAIQIHPNPTTGELRIEIAGQAHNDVQSVEIFDVYGKKVSSNHLIPTSSNHLINISLFPAGIYFLKITTETGIITKKVIKQ